MAAPTKKAEYLKKYMSSNDVKEKKRRKKKKGPDATNGRGRGLLIVDEDIFVPSAASPLRMDTASGEVIQGDGEDEAPCIADVIDERPSDVQLMELYRQSGRWKAMDVKKVKTSHSPGGSDLDISPARHRQRHDSDGLPTEFSSIISKHDLAASPSHHERHDSDASGPCTTGQDSDDASPPRRPRHDSAASESCHQNQDSDASPPRCRRHDSDLSPPHRKKQAIDSKHQTKEMQSKQASHRVPSQWQQSDSDASPPRRQPHREQQSDLDTSPPRRQPLHKIRESSPSWRIAKNADRTDSDVPHSARSVPSNKADFDEPMTLAGKKAGLSNAASMRLEAEQLKRKEEEAFVKIGDDMSGRNAHTVFRSKSGKRRDAMKEAAEKAEADAKRTQLADQYARWGKGLKQGEERLQRTGDALHEMAKPLARYRDDSDLDAMQRDQERAGDPMLAFMRSKKAREGAGGGMAGAAKPRYKGPAPPPSRFNIPPGYRWDGVDRSNGFEKQYFMNLNNKKAIEEQAYKWSTEDM